MTTQTKKYLLVVPTYGCPYIHAETPKDDDARLEMLQKLVGGMVERTPPRYYIVHPMFCDPESSTHHKRWNLVRQLLTSKTMAVYGNEDGMAKCVPNLALIAKGSLLIQGGQPMPGFGDEVLEVTDKALAALGFKPEDLTYVNIEDEEDE